MANYLEKYYRKSGLKNILSIFKINFQYILIIPALLGGLWQLIELSKISTSYIRFFSITQIIPDGLLILFILTLIYFSYKFSVFMLNLNREKDDDGKNIEGENKISFLYNSIMLIFLSLVLIYFYNNGMNPFGNKIALNRIIISIPIVVMIGTTILSLLKGLIIAIIEKFPKTIQKIVKSYVFRLSIAIGAFFVILFTIFTFLKVLSNFSYTYSLPKNLKNIEELKSSIEKVYPEFQNEIRYMNDKYIFIELTNKEKETKSLIFKFEKIFYIEKNIKENILKKCDTLQNDETSFKRLMQNTNKLPKNQ